MSSVSPIACLAGFVFDKVSGEAARRAATKPGTPNGGDSPKAKGGSGVFGGLFSK